MIFEVGLNNNKLKFNSLSYMNIKEFGERIGLKGDELANEKYLENIISDMIGETIFPDYLVIGRERSFQKEADIYAINENGDLILFELKVQGHYDRGKVLQVMDYAALYSSWNYDDISSFYNKKTKGDFYELFKQKFPDGVSKDKFNRKQKMIIISNSSDEQVTKAINYWKNQGIDIDEYFYRFYEINGKFIFEVTKDNFAIHDSKNSWINTNKSYNPEAYKEMIKEKKAAAYGNRAMTITENMKGGYVFLYHNGYGIIGAGKATKTIKVIHEEDGEKVKEKNIKLENFIHGCNLDNNCKIENSISPSELKKRLNQDFYFASTKVSLEEENAKKLYELCEEKFKK